MVSSTKTKERPEVATATHVVGRLTLLSPHAVSSCEFFSVLKMSYAFHHSGRWTASLPGTPVSR